eukprot:4623743-Pyramimonas_sp.AAC.1
MSQAKRPFSRIRKLGQRFQYPGVWRMSRAKRPCLAKDVLRYDPQFLDVVRMSQAKRSFWEPFLT